MKITVLIATFLYSFISQAQSISCAPHGEATYTKLEITKPDLSFDVPWFTAKLDNKFHQRKVFTVLVSPRKDSLLVVSKEGRSEFLLKFPSYAGPGIYHTTELILNEGSPREEKSQLMCEQIGDLGIANTCDEKTLPSRLFQAITNRDVNELETVLDCGANANMKNEFGCTPLLMAADSFCGQKLPSPISYNPITKALPIVDLLTNNGAIVDSKDPVSFETALHKFTKLGDFDVVSMLLDLEAEVDLQDNDGFTPLMRAVERNDKFLVQRFVEAGPDLSLKNKNGETALAIAINLGYRNLETLLQEPNAVIEISGQENGLCLPQQIQMKAGKLSKIVLKASPSKMFLMEAPGLSLSLMAGAGESVSQNIMPKTAGTFTFTCGVHGAPNQTQGQILVQ